MVGLVKQTIRRGLRKIGNGMGLQEIAARQERHAAELRDLLKVASETGLREIRGQLQGLDAEIRGLLQGAGPSPDPAAPSSEATESEPPRPILAGSSIT
jgi:hypothetical protein